MMMTAVLPTHPPRPVKVEKVKRGYLSIETDTKRLLLLYTQVVLALEDRNESYTDK